MNERLGWSSTRWGCLELHSTRMGDRILAHPKSVHGRGHPHVVSKEGAAKSRKSRNSILDMSYMSQALDLGSRLDHVVRYLGYFLASGGKIVPVSVQENPPAGSYLDEL